MSNLATDSRGFPVQTMRLGASQNVTVGGTSQQSTTFNDITRLVRVVSTVDCWIKISTDPTADTSSTLLPAGAIDHIPVRRNEKIAVIRDSSDGTLNITESGQ